MSLSKDKRERIKKYLLNQIEDKKGNIIKNAALTCQVTETTIRRYISQLLESETIKRSKENPSGYELVSIEKFLIYEPKKYHLEEDKIYDKDIYPLINDLPENVEKIWCYVFTEIMNNAIEHSNADTICCIFRRNDVNTSIFINDDGIGIFKKIQQYILEADGKNATIDDAMVGLFTGKFTTDASSHSGEGIFFSSRSMDDFYIISSGRLFTHDSYDMNIAKDLSTIDNRDAKDLCEKKGTIVSLLLTNETKRELKEVFDMFSAVDKGFYKTQIPIKNAIPNAFPVSRSQARRISIGFDKFDVVELDFTGVEDIGQAFADEIFRVFQNKNPQIRIEVSNANSVVADMIQRVKNTKM